MPVSLNIPDEAIKTVNFVDFSILEYYVGWNGQYVSGHFQSPYQSMVCVSKKKITCVIELQDEFIFFDRTSFLFEGVTDIMVHQT